MRSTAMSKSSRALEELQKLATTCNLVTAGRGRGGQNYRTRGRHTICGSWPASQTVSNASQIASTPSGAACSFCCLSCESVISLSGIFSAEVNRALFASRVHGCLLPVFSVASAAAISSKEGTCHNDMYGSGPR